MHIRADKKRARMKKFAITKRNGRWMYRHMSNSPIGNGSTITKKRSIYNKRWNMFFGHQKDMDTNSKGMGTEMGDNLIGISYYNR